jgi:hypothetical protein
VGPRAGLDGAEKRKILPLPGFKLLSLCRPALNCSNLYRRVRERTELALDRDLWKASVHTVMSLLRIS